MLYSMGVRRVCPELFSALVSCKSATADLHKLNFKARVGDL